MACESGALRHRPAACREGDAMRKSIKSRSGRRLVDRAVSMNGRITDMDLRIAIPADCRLASLGGVPLRGTSAVQSHPDHEFRFQWCAETGVAIDQAQCAVQELLGA